MRPVAGLAQAVGPRRRLLLCGYGGALALLAALLVVPGVARASSDVLDQSQTQVVFGYAAVGPGFSGGQSLGQTFTAGLTGGLDRVNLYLTAPAYAEGFPDVPSAPLTVEIRNAAGGIPGSTVLASASVPASSVTSSGGWVEVDFGSPAPVVSGTQYAIVAYTTDTDPNAAYEVGTGGAVVYAGGPFFLNSSAPPAPTTWEGFANSLAFQTYVAPGFTWSGFFSPISDSAANVLNLANAGQSIPVQFILGGDQGLSIFAAGSPNSSIENCNALGTTTDASIMTDTAGGSGLQYDPTTGTYTYVWKTSKSWSGTCRQLQVTLTDGSTHTADFHFK